MIDIFCLRCGAKIGWRYQNAQGVVIKCPCGTKNYVSVPERLRPDVETKMLPRDFTRESTRE